MESCLVVGNDAGTDIPHVLCISQIDKTFYETPQPIKDYIQEVKEQLCMLTDWPEAGVSAEEKLNFFREVRHAYGRTALLLSGGGGLGTFHIVSTCSWVAGCLPGLCCICALVPSAKYAYLETVCSINISIGMPCQCLYSMLTLLDRTFGLLSCPCLMAQ